MASDIPAEHITTPQPLTIVIKAIRLLDQELEHANRMALGVE